jgi:hypothetical protein
MVEVILMYVGILALVRGYLSLGRGAEATGFGARLAGLILMAPLPTTVIILFIKVDKAKEEGVQFNYVESGLIIWEVALVASCAIIGYFTAAVAFSMQSAKPRKVRRLRGVKHQHGLPLLGEGAAAPPLRRPPPRKRPSQLRLGEQEEYAELEELETVGPPRRPSRREEDRFDDDYDDYDEERPRHTVAIILALGIPLALLAGGLVIYFARDTEEKKADLTRQAFGDPQRRFWVKVPAGAKEATQAEGAVMVRRIEAKGANGLHYTVVERDGPLPAGGPDAQQKWLDRLWTDMAPNAGLTLSKKPPDRDTWSDGTSPGLRLEGKLGGGSSFQARVWLVRGRLYLLLVRGPADVMDKSPNVKQFLESLELPQHPRTR